jgi:hypothetical protein
MIKSIRQAIRVADLSAGGRPGPLGTIERRIEERRVFHPEPRYEQRRVIHPEVRYEARKVIHPAPRVEVRPTVFIQPEETVHVPNLGEALPPPWKQPIWQTPLPQRPVIKPTILRPDIHNKGSLLDVFC